MNGAVPNSLPDSDTHDLSCLLQQVGEMIVHLNSDWVVTYCNEVYLHFTGLRRADVIGRTPFDYMPSFKRSIFYEPGNLCLTERRPITVIGFSSLVNRWTMARAYPTPGGMVMLANDVSENVVEQRQLIQLDLKDTLTGLPNKPALLKAIASRVDEGKPFSVAVLGLNRFKAVNDSQGYSRGDMALLKFASWLQISSFEGEQVHRLNGDEFALLTDASDADALTERVRSVLAQTRRPVLLNGQVFVLGAAGGAVLAPRHGTDAETLLKRAALALRQAKRTRRDDVVIYQPRLETATRVRADLETELRSAVQAGGLSLMLQPKGSLAGQGVMGAEALVRWQHPVRGVVLPGHFLPLAQECGLMPLIDRWVLDQTLRQISELSRLGLAVPVSINVSVDSLSDLAFVDSVRDSLARSGVRAELLDIEIPEGALMRDVVTSAKVLADLNQLGVGISIDDFGTGYSSFAYLARFPVHTLKVDQSFVTEMTSSAASHRIVTGLVRLAHSLSLRVVAEGAETDEQIAMLQEMRCDAVQGYGYARPMSFEQFCEFTRRRRGTAHGGPA